MINSEDFFRSNRGAGLYTLTHRHAHAHSTLSDHIVPAVDFCRLVEVDVKDSTCDWREEGVSSDEYGICGSCGVGEGVAEITVYWAARTSFTAVRSSVSWMLLTMLRTSARSLSLFRSKSFLLIALLLKPSTLIGPAPACCAQ